MEMLAPKVKKRSIEDEAAFEVDASTLSSVDIFSAASDDGSLSSSMSMQVL